MTDCPELMELIYVLLAYLIGRDAVKVAIAKLNGNAPPQLTFIKKKVKKKKVKR